MGLMSEALTQILIPLASLVGIGFALLQWFLVSKVRISSGSELEDGYNDMLIEEDVQEEGIDSDATVAKCAEIQKAISEGGLFCLHTKVMMIVFVMRFCALNMVNKKKHELYLTINSTWQSLGRCKQINKLFFFLL